MRTISYGFVLDVHLVSYTKLMGTSDFLRNTLLCLHPVNVKKTEQNHFNGPAQLFYGDNDEFDA